MRAMRKAGRQQDEQWALEGFDRAPYVTVSIVRPDGTPYGLPLSLVRKDSRTFYFHCAHEGEKIDCLRSPSTGSRALFSRIFKSCSMVVSPLFCAGGRTRPAVIFQYSTRIAALHLVFYIKAV
mgnify:CR=1 FL=1